MYSYSLHGGSVVKNLPANAGDTRSIPGLGGSSGEGNDNPLQHSCLENPMDRGGRWAMVHGITKSQARLSTQHIMIMIYVWKKLEKNPQHIKSLVVLWIFLYLKTLS